MYNLVGFLKGLLIQNEVDPTKQLIIQISPSATTGTTTTVTAAQTANRNITLPDSDSQLVGDSTPQTLTNKTFDSTDTITGVRMASFTPDGTHTLTAPAVTDTLTANAATQTLTNKSIDASVNTLSNIPLADLSTVIGDANNFLVRNGSGQVISNTKAVPTGTVVGTSDSQTLTNKTIVAGSNTVSGLTNANLSGSAAISNANLATMANNTVKGNLSGITATPSDLAATSFSQVGAIPVRDSHANLFANNFVAGLAATSNSGGTTTLTVDSAYTQIFFGSGNQTVQLPAANTLTSHAFYISNESSGTVTIKDGSGATLQVMAASTHAITTVTNTGSVAGVWDILYAVGSSLSNPMTTKGDIIAASVGGTPQRLAVGTDGFVIAADSTATDGVSWQDPSNFRNHMINGAFDYWQFPANNTTTIANTATTYTADQWYINNTLGTAGVISVVQQTGAVDGSKFGLKATVSTQPSSPSSAGLNLWQVLSNASTIPLYNKTISFSIKVKAQGNINQVGIQFFYNTAESKSSATAIASSTVFSVNSAGFTTCTVNNLALGTAMTRNGVIFVRIDTEGVSSGNVSDLNNGFIVEQAILNVGPVAQPFRRQYDDPTAELASCMYFFEKSYNTTDAVYTVTNSGTYEFIAQGGVDQRTVPFKVPKRGTPSMNRIDPTTASITSDRAFDVTAVGQVFLFSAFESNGSWCPTNTGTAYTVGHVIRFHWFADSRI